MNSKGSPESTTSTISSSVDTNFDHFSSRNSQSADSPPPMTSSLLHLTNMTSVGVPTNMTSFGITTLDNVTSSTGAEDYIYEYDYTASLESLPLEEVIPVSLVYGFTLLFGLGGNALVITVVLRNERLRSITNIFLTSLASADLVLVLFCVPVKCAAFFSFTWAFGAFLCKAVHYIQAVSMVCSVMTLTVMSIERNIAILFPLRAKYLCTRGHAHLVIAIVWVLSFAMASPVLVGQKHKEVGEARKAYWCVKEWHAEELGLAYDIYMLVLLFLLPVSIMAIAYTGIARALWKGSALRRSMAVPATYKPTQPSPNLSSNRPRSWRPRPLESSTPNSSSSDNLSHTISNSNSLNTTNNLQAHYSRMEAVDINTSVCTTTNNNGGGNGGGRMVCKRSKLEQEKVKVVKMLVVVVLLFAICWGPVLINNVLVAAGVLHQYHYGYLKPMRQAFFLLSYLNSCLNPFVYGFMSAHFRSSFRQALVSCCWFRRRMRNPHDMASFRSFTTRSTVSFRQDPRMPGMSGRRKIYLTPDMRRPVRELGGDSCVESFASSEEKC